MFGCRVRLARRYVLGVSTFIPYRVRRCTLQGRLSAGGVGLADGNTALRVRGPPVKLSVGAGAAVCPRIDAVLVVEIKVVLAVS